MHQKERNKIVAFLGEVSVLAETVSRKYGADDMRDITIDLPEKVLVDESLRDAESPDTFIAHNVCTAFNGRSSKRGALVATPECCFEIN